MTDKKMPLIAAFAAAGLLVAGCSGTPATSPTAAAPTASETVGTTAQPTTTPTVAAEPTGAPAAPGDPMDVSEHNAAAIAAIETAEAEVSGRAVELDFSDGRWKVDVVVGDREHELEISLDGSSVVETDDDADSADSDDVRRLGEATVSMVDALKTALDAHDGRVDEIDLNDGYWEIDFDDTDDDIEVDYRTGEIRS